MSDNRLLAVVTAIACLVLFVALAQISELKSRVQRIEQHITFIETSAGLR